MGSSSGEVRHIHTRPLIRSADQDIAWIGFGLSALRNYMKILPANSSFTPTAWDPLLFRYTAAIIPISLVFAFASLFLFFVAPFSPIQALGDTDHHLYPIIAASIFGAAVIWYNFMRYLLRRQEKEVAEQKKGAEEKQTARSAQRPEDVPAPLPLGIAIDNGSDSGAEEDIPAYSKHAIGIRLVNEFNVDMKDYDEHTALDATQFHGNPRAIGWIVGCMGPDSMMVDGLTTGRFHETVGWGTLMLWLSNQLATSQRNSSSVDEVMRLGLSARPCCA